ncbi:MAG: S41 family peptidase [Gemmatimonadaceae bacterium]
MRLHSLVSRVLAPVSLSAVAVLSTSTAWAQSAGTSPITLDRATKRDVIDTMASRLRRHYVDADTGRLIAEHMLARATSGAYDAITSPARFAEVLTTDLRAINDDKHLRVIYDTENPGQRPGPEGIRMFGPPPAGTPRRSPPPGAADAARQSHYGLGRVDILPGNVGYLDTRGFSGGPEVSDYIVSALKYLEGTDAIIIDVRRNGGGSPVSVNLLISHFTNGDTTASLTVRNRSGNETFTRYTLASVPGPRRPTVPLYVLTSRGTASAAEDFSFVLKNMGRATIVGSRTAGAGHNNALLDVGHGFGTSISFTRVSDPRTGKEWERVGVQPDVEVDQARALDVAHALALKTIAEGEKDMRRRKVIELTRETVEAQSKPVQLSQATLSSYVGEYAEDQSVSLTDGWLLYSGRAGAPPETLIPLSQATFAVRATRFNFEPGPDGTMRLRVTPPQGESLTYNRLKPNVAAKP